jgi:hypothetical protein
MHLGIAHHRGLAATASADHRVAGELAAFAAVASPDQMNSAR